ncbi:hypothetical protein ACFXG6_33540 [Streptomyces roseus]|uniref:hypothetical protein n=1 Tax=Streptomyces roseus TaxID=66430 RepID=UPI0036A9203E
MAVPLAFAGIRLRLAAVLQLLFADRVPVQALFWARPAAGAGSVALIMLRAATL